MAVVFIPAPLRRLTGGRSRVDVAAASAHQLVEGLEARFPGFRSYLLDESGVLKAYVNVFVNGTEVRALAGLRTPLGETDEVSIIPAMAGGAA